MSNTVYIIVQENQPVTGDTCYFIRLGLGIFWECCHERESAREFSSRAVAVKMLHGCGKHVDGWRIVREVRQ